MTLIFTHVAFWFFKGGCKRKWNWSHSVMSNSLWPMDCSRPSSSVHGIFQARTLEWVAMPSFRGSSWPRDRTQVAHITGRLYHLRIPKYVDLPINKWSWKASVNFRTQISLSSVPEHSGMEWSGQCPHPCPLTLPLGGVWSANLRTAQWAYPNFIHTPLTQQKRPHGA